MLQKYNWFLPAELIIDKKGFSCLEVIASPIIMGLQFYLYFVVFNDEEGSKYIYQNARLLEPIENIMLIPYVPNQVYGDAFEFIEDRDFPDGIYRKTNEEKNEEFSKTYPMLGIHLENTYLK